MINITFQSYALVLKCANKLDVCPAASPMSGNSVDTQLWIYSLASVHPGSGLGSQSVPSQEAGVGWAGPPVLLAFLPAVSCPTPRGVRAETLRSL